MDDRVTMSGVTAAPARSGARAEAPSVIVFANAAAGSEARAFDLSIVVPVYNVAAYLRQCLDSIAIQQGAALQVIVVNDGSTDDSLALALAWAREQRIHDVVVLDTPNGGLSAARNVGLAHASGEFVAFLDSDDFIAPGIYAAMVRFARDAGCEVVYARSAVFDSLSGSIEDFYDGWVWDAVLRHRPALATSLRAEPRLMLLEPNACTRIVRRAFLARHGFAFPRGLHFEDIPVQVDLLLKAGTVGLVNATGYFYRVNRPGKITDQKSARRFDALVTVGAALEAARAAGIGPAIGSNLVYSATRMLFWCGENTPHEDRARFFREASALYAKIPRAWVQQFFADYAAKFPRLVLAVSALRTRSVRYLVGLSAGRPQPVSSFVRLFPARVVWLVGEAMWQTKRLLARF